MKIVKFQLTMADQKILRVENRHDSQAEAMKEPVNPHEVVKSLHQTLQEAATEEK